MKRFTIAERWRRQVLRILFADVEGWPEIDSLGVKDFIAGQQVDAAACSSPTVMKEALRDEMHYSTCSPTT